MTKPTRRTSYAPTTEELFVHFLLVALCLLFGCTGLIAGGVLCLLGGLPLGLPLLLLAPIPLFLEERRMIRKKVRKMIQPHAMLNDAEKPWEV